MPARGSEAFVRSFARGLEVLEAMGRARKRQTLSELADTVDVPPTALRRFVLTLVDLGFVRTDKRLYWLAPRVLRLGLSYLTSLPFWRQGQPVLEELCASVQQTCALSVLDGEDIVYVLRQHATRVAPTSPSLGSRLPAHAVAMGRVLLAAMDDDALDRYLEQASIEDFTRATVTDRAELGRRMRQVRAQGWAWVEGELDESTCELAVAVSDHAGNSLAAIDVTLPSGSHTEQEAVTLFLGPLRRAATRLRSAGE